MLYADRLERRDRAEEQASDAYRALYDQIVSDQEAEYEAEFGPEYRAVHPFKVNGATIHQRVMQQLQQQGE